MTNLPPKYNPAFASETELVNLFVVRRKYLDLLVEIVRENQGQSNQHVLVVGPRGIGKTTLVRRLAVEIRQDPVLDEKWFAITFPEEAYQISTPGEFWLETLRQLADQTNSDSLRATCSKLGQEKDEIRLRESALGELLAFSEGSKKRILVVIENLNMLLGEQLSAQAAWDLRHTLINEKKIMLVATAVSRFAGIDNVGRAWFELFAIYNLEPLTARECAILFDSITQQQLPRGQARAIQILTGGNPRLVRILAEFSRKKSFRNLLSDLVQLVDEHTEYFKSQIDALPAIERKVFAAVLDVWEPVSSQVVAESVRLSVSKTSALLNRLASRGAVSVLPRNQRKKLYQATERLYNIYYLVRRHGHPSARVRAAVQFMTHFYRRDQLVESTAELAKEACGLDPASRTDFVTAYREILNAPLAAGQRAAIIRATPKKFFESFELPEELRHFAEPKTRDHKPPDDIRDLPDRAFRLIRVGERYNRRSNHVKAVESFRKAVELAPESGHVLAHLAAPLYQHLGRLDEARELLEKAVKLSPNDWWVWCHKGNLARKLGDFQAAVADLENASRLDETEGLVWIELAYCLHDMGRYQECEQAIRKAIAVGDKQICASSWARLAELFHNHLNRFDEAENAYEMAISLQDPKDGDGTLLWNYARFVESERGQSGRAEEFYAKAQEWLEGTTRKFPDDARAWYQLGRLYSRKIELTALADAAFRRSIELSPGNEYFYNALAEFLITRQRFDEAENVYHSALADRPASYNLRCALASLLEREGKIVEAEETYVKALEANPDGFEAQAALGELKLRVGQTDEALELLRRSVATGKWKSLAWPSLLVLEWTSKRVSLDELTESLSNFLAARDRRPAELTYVAARLADPTQPELLKLAQPLVMEAVSRRGSFDDVSIACLILMFSEEWPEALKLLASLFDLVARDSNAIERTIDVAVSTAGAGYAKEVLGILERSKGRPALEPLEIGLRIFLKEDVVAPKEIAEVGADIAGQVKRLVEGDTLPTAEMQFPEGPGG